MKTITKISLTLVLAALLCLTFCCCANKEPEKPRPLFDEDGLYLEENFIFNAALEKDGAHLIENEKTEYCIRYEETTDESVLTAIEELRGYFSAVCGGIEVKTGAGEGKAIRVGKYGYVPSTPLVKTGAYIIEVGENDILIYAENVFGLTNGIYGFMEDYLGCIFLDHETTYIPPVKSMILAKSTDVQEPAFESRTVGDNEAGNYKSFEQKLRVREDETFLTDGCHHSLNMIPKDILAQHKEYYAFIDGARRTGNYLGQGPQLCFSNEEVINLLEEAVVNKQKNKTTDQTVWWDISQQDSMNYCECEKCSALIAESGGNAAAPIFRCVNIIAKRHPELKLSTLAYHYGSSPPDNIEFEDNVMIKWCIMSSYGTNDYSAPLTDGATKIAKQQYAEIMGWPELTDHIFVWDYITNYFNYLLPFPCLDAMPGNIRLLRDRGVEGVFSLNAFNNRGSWDRLKVNFASHLLWNPDLNETEFINRFLTVYFGKDAAPYIIRMYRKIHDNTCAPLWVYDFSFFHKIDYLSEKQMDVYYGLLDSAVEACGGDETYLKRLRYERMCLLYASIDLGYGTEEELASMKEEFSRLCAEFSITKLNELGTNTVVDFCR